MTTADATNRPEDAPAEAPSGDAIESVAFLARSEHRVRVLSLLDDGERTREELADAVGATRVTLSRILSDLEDRELIARNHSGGTHELTSFGELVYRDFSRLLGTVSVGQAYPDVVQRLPTEFFDFDLQCLADGELVAAESSDPLSAARVVASAVRNASSCSALLGTFISLPMYTIEEAVRDGYTPDGDVIFDSDVAETMLGDPDLLNRWQKIENAADSTLYYGIDDRIPCSIDFVDDETVFLTVDRERGEGFDIIKCEHPKVVAWAERTIEEYRAEATPLRRRVDEADRSSQSI